MTRATGGMMTGETIDDARRLPGAPGDLSFLAPIGAVLDWRIVLAFDALDRLDAFEVEPAATPDPEVVDRLLMLLGAADIASPGTGGVVRGPAFPSDDARKAIGQHARAIRQWASSLDDRAAGRTPSPVDPRATSFDRRSWLENMAVKARAQSERVADLVLHAFPRARTVLELGGGHGEYGRAFARRGCAVTMLDTPPVIAMLEEHGSLADDGITLIPGDFHTSLPTGPFDLVLCFGINHMFGAQKNQELFARIRPALSEAGGIAVSSYLGGTGERAALFAVHMLATGNGGGTHRRREYVDWFAHAGLELLVEHELDEPGRGLLLAAPARR